MGTDMDFLFGLGQVLCIIGLLCGAYFSITYVDREEPSLTADAEVQPAAHYDPLTSHVRTLPQPGF